jgi:hypothetical protein
MSDESGRRIQEQRAKQQATVAAAEAERQRVEQIAQLLPEQWSKATTQLHAAVTDANNRFTAVGEPRRNFKWQLLPQPEHGNLARAVIYHNDGSTPGGVSETTVVIRLDGNVSVQHPKWPRSFTVAGLGREQWDLLLADIYSTDTA